MQQQYRRGYTFGICDRDLIKNVLALFFLFTLFSIVSIISGLYNTDLVPSSAEEVWFFESWLVKHDRHYKDNAEKQRRFEIFQDNLMFVNQHNRLVNNTYELGLNRFADLTNDEFRSMLLGGKMVRRDMLNSSYGFKYDEVADHALPESIDWRDQGAVGPVKDQGQCGSSWAFSTVGAVEGINYIATGELIQLSEQELIDCDKDVNQGCSRGGHLMDFAFDFIVNNNGIHVDDYYPYRGIDRECYQNWLKNTKVVTIDGYESVPQNEENSLKKAVAHQPVSVAIDAGSRSFQLYKSGVFTGLCGTELNHGVVAVGYGTKYGIDYWIVRNSWGPSWGENGYITLERNLAGTNAGKCGIAMQPSYPTKQLQLVCDDYYSCPESTACCCVSKFSSNCSRWGCCPFESATVCDDHSNCCPQEFPVCDIYAKTCLLNKDSPIGMKAFKLTPARRRARIAPLE